MMLIRVQPSGMVQRLGQRTMFWVILVALSLLNARFVPAQTYSVLHKFTGAGDGGWPRGGLIQDAAGNLYGTAQRGGAFDFGTVFKLDPNRKMTVLHNFDGADGIQPLAGLVRDKAGNLYGTTWNGGTPEGGSCLHGCGTVFKLDKNGKETVLYAFTGGADGGNPTAPVTLDSAGNFYGTTLQGGDTSDPNHPEGFGVVFKLDKTGKETVLYTFTSHADGSNPYAGVILDESGNLYGTAMSGGTYGWGVVFELDQGGERVLHSFTDGTDGANPNGPLIRDRAGNLYGTASDGGNFNCGYRNQGCGVVFKLDKTGKETVVFTFPGPGTALYPSGGLTRDREGNLYGTTSDANGAVFKVNKNGKQKVLHYFVGSGLGAFVAGVIMDKAGALYGTTAQAGNGCSQSGCGIVFKLTP